MTSYWMKKKKIKFKLYYITMYYVVPWASQVDQWQRIHLQCRRHRKLGFNPWKIPWRRARSLCPVFLPGESHRLRSLVGYSPMGCKESDTTEQLYMHACVCANFNHIHIHKNLEKYSSNYWWYLWLVGCGATFCDSLILIFTLSIFITVMNHLC